MSSIHHVAIAFSLVACGGGGDGDKGRPLGSSCNTDSECGEGACLEGKCLDPAADEDRDGLTNAIELTLGTGIFDPDSDDDDLGDRAEVAADLAPVDTDSDGVHDALESDLADADGDCVSDQRDPDVTDRATLVARACRTAGVCADASEALAVTCGSGATKGAAACDYAAVAAFEPEEATCDQRDNDCDGATDEDLPPGACVLALTLLTDAPATRLGLGDTLALRAIASLIDGSEADRSDVVDWRSADPAIATVDPSGLVTARDLGTTRVTATLDDVTAEIPIQVVVTLLPFVVADTPIDAIVLGVAEPDAATGTVATIVSRGPVRALALDGRARYDGLAGDVTTIVSQPPLTVAPQ